MNRGNGTRRKAGRQSQPGDMVALDPEIATEVEELFNKVQTYTKPSNGEWCIPGPREALRHPPREHRRLQALKASLNSVKNQLSDKDLEVWHQHTNSTNRAGKVIAAVRHAANAEICTQAWCKFYEILGAFSLIPAEALQNGELNTVHLCEAPGAFICALNHYVKTSQHTRYCDWTWAANTLNPYHEGNGGHTTIVDDRLIANTLPWWFFGSDNTGNIMSQRHLLELQAFVGNMRSGVHVVTADGSFDCQENPDEQEALVASLHYCEATAALLLLATGGSLVLKMFTLYEHTSVCLLYLLNCCFGRVSVFKPATSKAGNSEVYVVCLHYHGKQDVRPLLAKMIRSYGPRLAGREALLPGQLIPPSFLEQHERVCAYFHALQVQTIEENLRLFTGMSEEQRQRLDYIRDYTAQQYLQRLQVSHLPRARWVSRHAVSPAWCSAAAGRPLGQKRPMGSFNERRELRTLKWRERVARGCHGSEIQAHSGEAAGAGCALEGPAAGCDVQSWYVLAGAALTAVRNSPFCEGGLLDLLNEALVQATEAPWERFPPCHSCQDTCAASVLSEVLLLCEAAACGLHGGRHGRRRCLVFSSRPVWAACQHQVGELALDVCAEPSFPGRVTLHDGEPAYQRQLIGCVLLALSRLSGGDTLLLPLLSALTRITAALVLCLHLSFRLVTFRCPAPSGTVGALLVCVGFCPDAAAPLLPMLSELQGCMGSLASREENTGTQTPSAGHTQVLQFVPMEELLKGQLPDFLWAMNSAIIRQKLHLLMQA